MRIITDPITDSVLYILNKLFFPIIFRAVRYVLYAVIWSIIALVNAAAGPEPVDKLTEYVGAVVRLFLFLIARKLMFLSCQ